MASERADFSRPATLAGVAARAQTLAEFGRNLQDFLHTLRGLSTRARVAAAIADEPPLLAGRFADGDVADAYLAAYAELIALRLKLPAPAWAFAAPRIRCEPWFAEATGDPAVRHAALLHAPLPFRRRNLYAARVDLPLRIRPGRPAMSVEHKRAVNAARQRRFRERRDAELRRLRREA